jgi:hypothetical protein
MKLSVFFTSQLPLTVGDSGLSLRCALRWTFSKTGLEFDGAGSVSCPVADFARNCAVTSGFVA